MESELVPCRTPKRHLSDQGSMAKPFTDFLIRRRFDLLFLRPSGVILIPYRTYFLNPYRKETVVGKVKLLDLRATKLG